jgi:hypothetical protein
MKSSVYTKIFVLILVAFGALALISYSRSETSADKEECTGSSKCDAKKVQSDFLIWESFSKSLLSEAIGCDDN